VDHPLAKGRLLVGAFGGYDRAALTLGASAGRVHDRRYRAGTYVTTTLGSAYVTGAVAGAEHRFETDRAVVFTAMLDPQFGGGPLFGGIDRTATVRYSGREAGGFVESGWSHRLGRVLVQPFGGLDASHVTSNGFAESGAGSVSLRATDAATSSVRAAVGLRAARPVSAHGTVIAPRADVRYLHELLDPVAAMRVAFADASAVPFTTTSAADSARAVAVSTGVVVAAGRFLLSADYRAVFAATGHRHVVILGVGF
jgi:uncharacterized protein with beta-barrel porin domain